MIYAVTRVSDHMTDERTLVRNMDLLARPQEGEFVQVGKTVGKVWMVIHHEGAPVEVACNFHHQEIRDERQEKEQGPADPG